LSEKPEPDCRPVQPYLNDAPIHGLSDIRIACSQRILAAAPSPLAPS
jgi:hypothetical protein